MKFNFFPKLLVSFLIIGALTPVFAAEDAMQRYEQALKALNKNDCDEVIKILNEVADLPIPDANVPESKKSQIITAIGMSQGMIGQLYQDGLCYPVNYNLAFKYLSAGIKKYDSTLGNYTLGRMLMNGQGTTKNYKLALFHFYKSVKIVPDSAVFISLIYKEGGFGVQKDTVQSYMWVNLGLSQSNNFLELKPKIPNIISIRSQLEKSLSADDLNYAQNLSSSCASAIMKDRYKGSLPKECNAKNP